MVGVILICAHRVFRVPEDLLTECARAHPEACKTDKSKLAKLDGTPCLTVVCLASCAVSRRGYDCSLLWDNVDKGFETNTPISWIISSFKEDARFGATTQSILSHESPESHSLWRQFVVIGIAQFSGNLYEFCCKDADDDGKTVIIAVIDGDYLRRSFGDVLEFLPIADSVTKLTARCEARTDTCVETVAAMF
ncbi:hypothetical protein Bca101_059034 [Brassica carinata]